MLIGADLVLRASDLSWKMVFVPFVLIPSCEITLKKPKIEYLQARINDRNTENESLFIRAIQPGKDISNSFPIGFSTFSRYLEQGKIQVNLEPKRIIVSIVLPPFIKNSLS
jgi:hypothetical protein